MTQPIYIPQDISVEQALLGAAILNPEAIRMAEGIITAQDFAEPLHELLWELMATSWRIGRKLDAKLLVSAIGKDSNVPVAAGMTAGQYIARLAAEATTIINAPDYAWSIRDLADQRKLHALGALLRREMKYDPIEMATESIEQLDNIIAARVNTGTPGLEMRDAVIRAVDFTANAYARNGAISGVTWGVKDMDAKTLGIQLQELTILAGRPGMGKTAVALGVARSAAKVGKQVVIESLEMSDTPLTHRMIADELYDESKKRLSYWNFRSGKISEEDFGRMAEAAKRIAELPIRIEQRPAQSVQQISARARQRKRRYGLDLLIVDHIQLMQPSERYRGNTAKEIGEHTSGLKALAKELGIAVLALCQLNRAVEGREDKRPSMADLRGSGEIEQDADTVVMLYREAYYLSRAEPTPGSGDAIKWMERMEIVVNQLEAIVEKQRNGPLGRIMMFCDIGCNAIRDISKEQYLPEGYTEPKLGL